MACECPAADWIPHRSSSPPLVGLIIGELIVQLLEVDGVMVPWHIAATGVGLSSLAAVERLSREPPLDSGTTGGVWAELAEKRSTGR
jgi:hypothetical protein